jgi:hypothetical protein
VSVESLKKDDKSHTSWFVSSDVVHPIGRGDRQRNAHKCVFDRLTSSGLGSRRYLNEGGLYPNVVARQLMVLIPHNSRRAIPKAVTLGLTSSAFFSLNFCGNRVFETDITTRVAVSQNCPYLVWITDKYQVLRSR